MVEETRCKLSDVTMDELFNYLDQEVIPSQTAQDFNFQDELLGLRNSPLQLEPNTDDLSESDDIRATDYVELPPSIMEEFLQESRGLHEDPPDLEDILLKTFDENGQFGTQDENTEHEEQSKIVTQFEEILNQTGKIESDKITHNAIRVQNSKLPNTARLGSWLEEHNNTSPSWRLDCVESPPRTKSRNVDTIPVPPSETTCHDYFHTSRVPSPKKQRRISSPRETLKEEVSTEYCGEEINPHEMLLNENLDPININLISNTKPNTLVPAEKIIYQENIAPVHQNVVEEQSLTDDNSEEIPKTFYCRELGRELSLFNYNNFPPETQRIILRQMRAGRQVIELPDPDLTHRKIPSHQDTASHPKTSFVQNQVSASLLQEAAMAAGLLDFGSFSPEATADLNPIPEVINTRDERKSQISDFTNDEGTSPSDNKFHEAQLFGGEAFDKVPATSENSCDENVHNNESPTRSQSHDNSSCVTKDPDSFDALGFLNQLMGNAEQKRSDADPLMVNEATGLTSHGASDHFDIIAELNQAPVDDDFAFLQKSPPLQDLQPITVEVGGKNDTSIERSCDKLVNENRPNEKPEIETAVLYDIGDEDLLDSENLLELMCDTNTHLPGYETNTSCEIDDFFNEYLQDSVASEKDNQEQSRMESITVEVTGNDSRTSQGKNSFEIDKQNDTQIPSDTSECVGFSVNNSVHSNSSPRRDEASDDEPCSQSECKSVESTSNAQRRPLDIIIENDLDPKERDITDCESGSSLSGGINETVDALDEINKYLASLK